MGRDDLLLSLLADIKRNNSLFLSLCVMSTRWYSSVVEHFTADQNVPNSMPGTPLWMNADTAKLKPKLTVFYKTDLKSFQQQMLGGFTAEPPPKCLQSPYYSLIQGGDKIA